MKLNGAFLLKIAGTSLFIGLIIISIGLGALFPAMHRLSAPLVCRGEFEIQSTHYSYKPGQSGTQLNFFCHDENGRHEVTLLSIIATGVLVSVPIFLVLVYRVRSGKALPAFTSGNTSQRKSNANESALARLTELKKMRDADLISEAEYEGKKKEIMDEM